MTQNSAFVPHPVTKCIVTVVEDGQEITDEQRSRVVTWLSENGVDPSLVVPGPITLEYKAFGERKGRQFIGFRQYYLEDGHKVHALVTNEAVTFHRYVEQSVELAPDPTWEGWKAYDARIAERRKANEADAA